MFYKLFVYMCMIVMIMTDAQAAVIPYKHAIKNVAKNIPKYKNTILNNNVVNGKICKIISPLFRITGKSMPGGCGVNNIIALVNNI